MSKWAEKLRPPQSDRREPRHAEPTVPRDYTTRTFIERSCRNKQGYSKVEAATAINHFRTARRGRHGQPDDLRMYQCEFCNRWHLTKS